jgi:hypothetical protein
MMLLGPPTPSRNARTYQLVTFKPTLGRLSIPNCPSRLELFFFSPRPLFHSHFFFGIHCHRVATPGRRGRDTAQTKEEPGPRMRYPFWVGWLAGWLAGRFGIFGQADVQETSHNSPSKRKKNVEVNPFWCPVLLGKHAATRLTVTTQSPICL